MSTLIKSIKSCDFILAVSTNQLMILCNDLFYLSTRCAVGYHDYPACKPCDCFYNGTYGHVCTPSYGTKCPCLPGFAGNKCNRCAYGYYGFPNCKCENM